MVESATPPLQREDAWHGTSHPEKRMGSSTLFKVKVRRMNGSFVICHLLTHSLLMVRFDHLLFRQHVWRSHSSHDCSH